MEKVVVAEEEQRVVDEQSLGSSSISVSIGISLSIRNSISSNSSYVFSFFNAAVIVETVIQ